MNKYSAPDKWVKINKYTVEASDGSKAWFDPREIVGLKQPNGCYISLGAEIDNHITQPNNNKNNPSLNNIIMHVYLEKNLYWEIDGYVTKMEVPKDSRPEILKSISNAMKELGFIVEYIEERANK